MKKALWLVFSLMIFSLTACGISLASDITPPPNYQPPSDPAPVVQETSSPLVPPNLRNGEAVYGIKCVDCHGATGMGDGAQADQLPVAVAPIGDIDFAKNARPVDWYQIITDGNLDRFMPGFASLSDRERWDVTAYALSLSLDNLDVGSVVFADQCAACHAANNAEGIVDFTRPQDLSELSLVEIAAIIQNGKGTRMPNFSDLLSEDETWAAAAYVRSLSFDRAGEQALPEPNSEAMLTEEPQVIDQFSVKGKLENVDPIPTEQTVMLIGYDGMDQVYQSESTVDSQGIYQFLDLDYVEGRVYQIVAVIDGVQHSSEVFHNPVVDAAGFVDIPVVIMATTTDVSRVYAERMHVFFEFVDANTLQVVELLIVQNPSNLVVVPQDMNTPVLSYQLPAGATNLQFQEGAIGERYILTETGFGDLQPIEPNVPKQFLYAYNLPYENKMSLEIDLPMDVEAAIVMLPAGVGVEIQSEQLAFMGEQPMQGTAIQTYSSGKLTEDQNLVLNFQGKYKAVTPIAGVATSDMTSLIIGGMVLVSAIGVGLIYLRGKRSASGDDGWAEEDEIQDAVDVNDLLDAVIALDDAYAKGELPEEAYHNRRQEIIQQISRMQAEEE